MHGEALLSVLEKVNMMERVDIMAKKVIVLLMILCLVCFCACGGPSKEPVLPTPDGIVCNNEVFADLEAGSVEEVVYHPINISAAFDGIYRSDIVYDFVKLLKEASFYEVTREDTETIYGFLQFEIILKNGTTYGLWFSGEYLSYNGRTYTYPDDLLDNLQALFHD